MTNASEVIAALNKNYGKEVVLPGSKVYDRQRLPTGCFPFDLATGGGLPRGKVSILYGLESSGKTTLALKAIAQQQRIDPTKKSVLVDLEVSYDPKWAELMGVDNDNLLRVLPDYAEQAIDIIEAFLDADDVGIIVVDSLAAMIPATEADNSAEKGAMGNAGLAIGKLYRKITVALSRAEREDRHPVVLLINQVRMKLGVLYGDPETMPGGFAPKFMSSLTVRLYGKDEIDKAVHASLPAWKVITGTIKKYKVPVTARNFEIKMAAVPMADKGLEQGATNDWPIVQSYLKSTGVLKKGKKEWELLGETFKTLSEIRAKAEAEPDYYEALQNTVVELTAI